MKRALKLKAHTPALATIDEGERDLWIHAMARKGGWILCGPDIASIRFGVVNGYHDRLISLEELLSNIGFRTKNKLPEHQTRRWLRGQISRFLLESFSNNTQVISEPESALLADNAGDLD